MRVERKLETPPPPVSPERAENRPSPPREVERPREVEKPQEEAKPKDVGRNLDVTA